jgi:3',5'-cyclic AMP phosphodiesterase CpdA
VSATYDSWIKGTSFAGKNFLLGIDIVAWEQIWKHEIAGDVFSFPCNIDNGRMIIVGSTNNAIYALEANSEIFDGSLTMIQPNVYWTLEAPFVTIIGLYSNISGELDEEQIEWLINELKNAPANKAIILSVHHSQCSVDRLHGGYKVIANILDDAIIKSGRIVDLVISSHIKNYQRFTRQIGEREIPYIIAETGEYMNLNKMPTNADGSPINVPYKMLRMK